MNLKAYNLALLLGWLLTSAGVGLWSLPAGLTVAGVLLIALTLWNARLAGVRAG